MARKYYASGGYIEKHPSGGYKKVSASGTVTIHHASGHTETTSALGVKTIYHVTGKVEKKVPWARTDSESSSKSRRKSSQSGAYTSTPKPQSNPETKVEDIREEKPEKPRFTVTKTPLENDNKETKLKKHHKSKSVYGIDIYSFTDPKTGEEKWLAYANPSVLKTHDSKYECSEEVVVLGINDENNTNDHGRATMSVKGYLDSDIALLYEVVFNDKKSATINTEGCYVVHIKTGEMIPLTSRHLVHFSNDGEKMCVLNPFAPSERYDIYSTRIDDKMLESYVNPNEMI